MTSTIRRPTRRQATVAACRGADGSGHYRFAVGCVPEAVFCGLSVAPKWTRPYLPQTNGKIERFHRTLADGWGYARCYNSEPERRQALLGWLHHYTHHGPHTACGSLPPFSRLTNVPGQYSDLGGH